MNSVLIANVPRLLRLLPSHGAETVKGHDRILSVKTTASVIKQASANRGL